MDAAALNRRQDRRVLHEVAIDLRSENNFYTGFTLDISAGGIFVVAREPLPIGTEVEFELTLGAQVVKVPVQGVVRWTRQPGSHAAPGMGIEFVALHPRLRERINAFIERRDTLFWDAE